MMLERTLRLLVAILALVVLGACGTGGETSPNGSTTITSDVAAIPGVDDDDITVSGPLGSSATWDPASGAMQFEVETDTVGRLALMDTSHDFGWTATYPYWFTDLDPAGLTAQATSSHKMGHHVP